MACWFCLLTSFLNRPHVSSPIALGLATITPYVVNLYSLPAGSLPLVLLHPPSLQKAHKGIIPRFKSDYVKSFHGSWSFTDQTLSSLEHSKFFTNSLLLISLITFFATLPQQGE